MSKGMNMDREQFCTECGDPTGRAGNFHESVFVGLPGEDDLRGPLCDDCLENLRETKGAEVIYR